uniref:Zeta toxin domain-containing protein n=1 Tax=viral metagenome TaxID=1070528 RepID=A0A6C0DH70_9ZZZZ
MNTLDNLTDETVDNIFHITEASPTTNPVFLIIAGIPGVGKSSAHKEAVKRGYIPKHNYATINLDTLVESLKVFRAASSMAHFLKLDGHEDIRFGTIRAYQSKHQDLELFDWYDKIHETLDPQTKKRLDKIRSRYSDATAIQSHSIQELGADAIERAVKKQVSVVYETTLSFNKKEGIVKKIDAIMDLLKDTSYRVILLHIVGPIEEIAKRIHHRQEYQTPSLSMPFYRYMPASETVLSKIDKDNKEAVKAIQTIYPSISVVVMEATMNESRLPKPKRYTLRKQRHKLSTVFGPSRSTSGYSADRSRSSSRSVTSHSKAGSK